MRRPSPLDPRLGDAFTVAEALEAGVTPDRLRSSDLHKVFHGIRTRDGVPILRAYAPRLRPGDRFSHTTSAQLWGAPIPRAREGEVHVTAFGRERPRARGASVTSRRSAIR